MSPSSVVLSLVRTMRTVINMYKDQRVNELAYLLSKLRAENKLEEVQVRKLLDMVCSSDKEMQELGRKIALDLYFDNE